MKRWTIVLPVLAIALFLLIPKPQRSSKTELPNPSSSPQSKPSPRSGESWQVIKVADGDTITVTQGDRKEKIRFCGVDSPESKQPLGQESKANLQRLIDEANGQVQLSFIERDRYGRQVAEVFANNKFLQEEQVKAGLSYHYAKYSGNCPHRDAIVAAEAIAQSNHSGVWSGNYEKPWDYRRTNK